MDFNNRTIEKEREIENEEKNYSTVVLSKTIDNDDSRIGKFPSLRTIGNDDNGYIQNFPQLTSIATDVITKFSLDKSTMIVADDQQQNNQSAILVVMKIDNSDCELVPPQI